MQSYIVGQSRNPKREPSKLMSNNDEMVDYDFRRAEKGDWNMVSPYDGKALILLGIPRNALPKDIERFLSSCQFDSSLLDMFFRTRNQATIRMARVHFRSQALAMHTYITKNRGFILNNQINVEVLH
ncbi:hypothetical protein ACS0TY_017689 [Phlomoides rotata]